MFHPDWKLAFPLDKCVYLMKWSESVNTRMTAAVQRCREKTKQFRQEPLAALAPAYTTSSLMHTVLMLHCISSADCTLFCQSLSVDSPDKSQTGKNKNWWVDWQHWASNTFFTTKSECQRHSTQHFNTTALARDRCPQQRKWKVQKGDRCPTWCSQQGLVGRRHEVGCLHFQTLSHVPSSACTACLHITTTHQHHISDDAGTDLFGNLNIFFFSFHAKLT